MGIVILNQISVEVVMRDGATVRWNNAYLALFAVLLVGGVLCFWGITYGLPYTYRADEPTMVVTALRMLQTDDLNPHWLGNPSLMFYLNALIFGIYYLLGNALVFFQQPPIYFFPIL